MIPFLAYTEADRWVPGIGDPSVMGWLTVVAYFAAAVVCGLAFRKAGAWGGLRLPRSHESKLWLLLIGAMLFLGINKQLDLQTWFTLFLKSIARNSGWYEQRRIFQALFILVMALGGAAAFLCLCWLLRGALRQTWLALAGLLFLGVFVLVRASSFHYVDQFLGFKVAGLKMNWIFELSGIALVAFGAWRRLRTASNHPTGFIWISAGDRLAKPPSPPGFPLREGFQFGQGYEGQDGRQKG